MNSKLFRRERIIDTFAARDLKMPEIRNTEDNIGCYSIRKGYGLELRRRKHRKRQRIV